jgi:hypothetical protein
LLFSGVWAGFYKENAVKPYNRLGHFFSISRYSPMNSTSTGLPKTRDLVKHYAAQLLDAGAEVSVATIRSRILEEHGVTASPNVVSDEVRQFWARTGPLLSALEKAGDSRGGV